MSHTKLAWVIFYPWYGLFEDKKYGVGAFNYIGGEKGFTSARGRGFTKIGYVPKSCVIFKKNQ